MVGKAHGFTIIEVMLFLSISGALLVALMVGVSTNINQQRYHDSLSSLVGQVQQQYSEVSSTRNDRDDSWRCSNSVAEQNPANGQPRGTTDCLVLGRYIRTIDNEGKVELELGDIIGSEPLSGTIIDNDTAALSAYNPRASSFEPTTYTPEWSAQLRDTSDHVASFTILIVRSPLSGLLRVFAVNGPMPTNLADMMTVDAARQKVTACVAAADILPTPRQGVIVDAATAGPNGVSTTGDGGGC